MEQTSTRAAAEAAEPFLDEVGRWVQAAALDAGLRLDGTREQPHVRPWSTAIRFGADGGDLWCKVNGPGTTHEAGLVATLADLEPGLVPQVVAVDVDRGWSLSRDAGPVLRTVAPADQLWSRWEELLVRYAEAQLRLAEHADELRASGLPVATPRTLPWALRELVEELGRRPAEAGGLDSRDAGRLRGLLPAFDDWCAELDGSGVPLTVQHDDLHSGNVCWAGSAAAAWIIDWGDASWGSPLGTMLVTLNSLAWAAGCDVDDPRVLRVRDAYLEPFGGHDTRAELLRQVELVRRTGCVTRALSYRAALLGEPRATHAEYDFPVRAWLLEMLD